eukprot:TRINITY_DN5069_c0_g1_i3.p1 TRINITY_DN5069_c0_g1~~TRINITY_DN5069_c0_g1_i3.p1  ORF type:complete len:816 (+),score=191.78 TRINITY_DN5069_c0_g1_i3:223-2670(+)
MGGCCSKSNDITDKAGLLAAKNIYQSNTIYFSSSNSSIPIGQSNYFVPMSPVFYLDDDDPYSIGYSPSTDNKPFVDVKDQEVQTLDNMSWNEQFQTALDGYRNHDAKEKERVVRVENILDEFSKRAKLEIKKILAGEISRDLSIGGIAGGEKFVSGGILFKFVRHTSIYESNSDAMKTAGNELRMLNFILSSNIPVTESKFLRTPLMVLVDYRGFRVTAVSLAPVGRKTLIFGTADAGETFHVKDPLVQPALMKLADQLNLKSHLFVPKSSRKGIEISVCADLEVHKGLDGRYYVIDTARLIPPTHFTHGRRAEHLFNQFRPEFMKTYSKRLCSDAFTGFASHGADVHNQEVVDATNFLLNRSCQRVAHELPCQRCNFSVFFHHHGVNMRYLGIVYIWLAKLRPNEEQGRQFILEEMVVRSVKCIGRDLLRNCYKGDQSNVDVRCLRVVADLANRICGVKEGLPQSTFEEFWKTSLPHEVQQKFFPLQYEDFMPKDDFRLLLEDRWNLTIKCLEELEFALSVKDSLCVRGAVFDQRFDRDQSIEGDVSWKDRRFSPLPLLTKRIDHEEVVFAERPFCGKSLSVFPRIRGAYLLREALSKKTAAGKLDVLAEAAREFKYIISASPDDSDAIIQLILSHHFCASTFRFSLMSKVFLEKVSLLVGVLRSHSFAEEYLEALASVSALISSRWDDTLDLHHLINDSYQLSLAVCLIKLDTKYKQLLQHFFSLIVSRTFMRFLINLETTEWLGQGDLQLITNLLVVADKISVEDLFPAQVFQMFHDVQQQRVFKKHSEWRSLIEDHISDRSTNNFCNIFSR